MTSVHKMVLVPVEKYKNLQSNNCQSVEKTDSSSQTEGAPKVTPVTAVQKQTEPPKADTTTSVQSPVQSHVQSRNEAKEYYVQVPRKTKRKPALKWITL